MSQLDQQAFKTFLERVRGGWEKDWAQADFYYLPVLFGEGSRDILFVAKEYDAPSVSLVRGLLAESREFPKTRQDRPETRLELLRELRGMLDLYELSREEPYPALKTLETKRGWALYGKLPEQAP